MNVKMFQNGDLTNTSLMFLCNPLQININICFYFWDNASIFKVVLIKKKFLFSFIIGCSACACAARVDSR